MTGYAELQVTTNFSFLRGASHPEEMAAQADALGLAAVAVTDRNSLAGVVRAHVAAKKLGVRLVVGARLDLTDAPSLICLPTDRAAYGRLSRLLTLGKRRAPKGECWIGLADVLAHADGQIFLILPPETVAPDEDAAFAAALAHLGRALAGRAYLAASHLYRGDDEVRLAALARLAVAHGTPLVATNDVHAHCPERRVMQDVLTCIRERCTIDAAGYRLFANAERHLKPAGEMARLFRRHPEAVARTLEIARACRFSLDELRYEYPDDEAPPGTSAQDELARLTWQGAVERYGGPPPDKVRDQLAHELELIGELGYAPYFLTVQDIVRFARDRGILCQGRGSAANSAVCYCLGITAVDPSRMDLLFERFVSAERDEPPDIDVDFEHERREEVIQYIYEKYGRTRAGLTATVIHYRSRRAIREVGKALGLSEDTVSALAGTIWGWRSDGIEEERLIEVGLDPGDRRLRLAVALANELCGFPRHLSQHVGGFVITRGPLDEVVPICNAAMEDRTNIEWDKDDLDALGILKIDVLGLGMLTCIRKGFELLETHGVADLSLATVPAEDKAVYDMLCRADSIGVFQVESRAQMTMLPRLKPRDFYDLVIEVAIVRPGPIQGDMVHPYLRRRRGEEAVDYPSPELEAVLSKTLGVPLFQEQAMKIAIVAAGFTPSEADSLRRAMATFRRMGTIHSFRAKLIEGMVSNGYDRDFAERCFKQIEGFGEYGFPESHAASFALLVYVSAWLKCHHPAAFAAALLNAQPMGFYAPAQIVRDARRHGVEVRGVDVNHSGWDCTLERGETGALALRLGLRQIKGFSEDHAAALTEARAEGAAVEQGGEITPHPPTALSRRGPLPLPQGERDFGSAPLDPSPLAGEGGTHRSPQGEGGRVRGDAARLPESPTDRVLPALPFPDPRALWRRARLPVAAMEILARADGFGSMGLSRRQALWEVRALGPDPLPLFAGPGADETGDEPEVQLPLMALGEEVTHDYASLRLSLRAHPLALLREALDRAGVVPAARLGEIPHGRRVTVAGLAITRQRPGTASGVIFITLEDETDISNLVVWPAVFEANRRAVMSGRLLVVTGELQREGIVIHVIAERIEDRTDLLHTLAGAEIAVGKGGIEPPYARADQVKRPVPPDRQVFPSRDFR